MSPSTDAVSRAPSEIQAMFTRIAKRYDRANDALTFGHHRAWKGALVRAVAPAPGERALDLATGTGDVAFRLAKAVGESGTVVGLDFTAAMLDVARERGPALTWLEGDMLALPFPDASFDVVTVAFGLRNVADLKLAVSEAVRVLAPGGRFASLDLGKPSRSWARPFVRAYSFGVVPRLGGWVGGDSAAFRYLPASNEDFESPAALAAVLRDAGLVEVKARELLLGAAALVSGRKPG